MNIFKEKIPKGFTGPTALPPSEGEAKRWQEDNYKWWQEHPMRYDWRSDIGYREFSKDFFQEIDRRFFSDSKEYAPWSATPFDTFIDFESLQGKDVLEIGVGNGSHAALLASRARSFTGIDLTDYAVLSTQERFKAFGLTGAILKADAECLPFKSESFDYVWSWGVIHHSSNTGKIIEEIHRVLRPGGEALIMTYYRGWWAYYVVGVLRGLISGMFFRGRSLHNVVQLNTDGAIGRYYTYRNLADLGRNFLTAEFIGIFGPASDFLLLPHGRVKEFVKQLIPNSVARFLTHTLRMGSFIVVRYMKSV